jgi:hypothetical protein
MNFVSTSNGAKPIKKATYDEQRVIVQKAKLGVGPHVLADAHNLTVNQVRYILKKNGLNGKSFYYTRNRNAKHETARNVV